MVSTMTVLIFHLRNTCSKILTVGLGFSGISHVLGFRNNESGSVRESGLLNLNEKC